MRFLNRQEAGCKLATALRRYKGRKTIVIGLVHGGVVTACEVAKKLRLPVGVLPACRIPSPFDSEYAVGAVSLGTDPAYNQYEVVDLDPDWLRQAAKFAQDIILQEVRIFEAYMFSKADIAGSTVLVIDDGMATGLTMQSAATALRSCRPRKIIVAVPIASEAAEDLIRRYADEVVVLGNPADFAGAIGNHYQIFPDITDNETLTILKEATDDLASQTPINPHTTKPCGARRTVSDQEQTLSACR